MLCSMETRATCLLPIAWQQPAFMPLWSVVHIACLLSSSAVASAAGGDDWDAAIAKHITSKHLKPAVSSAFHAIQALMPVAV